MKLPSKVTGQQRFHLRVNLPGGPQEPGKTETFTYVMSNRVPGSILYFSIVAQNGEGIESARSNFVPFISPKTGDKN